MNFVTKSLAFLVSVQLVLTQSVPPSPCPSIFNYETGNQEPGKWFGQVLLSTDIVLHGLWLNIILDEKADILGNWVGYVSTNDNKDFKIENTTMKIIPGPAQSVRFFVQYDQNGKTPRLAAIRLNGREICSVGNPIPALNRPVVITENNYRPTIDNTYNQDNSYRPTTSRPINNYPSNNDNYRPNNDNYRPTNNDNRPNNDNFRPSNTESRPLNTDNYRPTNTDTYRPADNYSPSTNDNINRPSNIDNYRPTNTGNTNRPTSNDNYRPNNGDNRPVYTQTINPPIGETNAKPFSVGGGDIGAQSVAVQTKPVKPPRRKPSGSVNHGSNVNTDDSYDYENEKPGTIDYFTGDFDAGKPHAYKPKPTTERIDDEQCGKVRISAAPLVVYGKPTLAGQWPWHIALYQTQTVDNKYICGGTLVSKYHVITAAHCVTRKLSSRVVNKSTLTVYLGKHNLRTSTDGVQIKFVSKISVHPEYNATSYDRDVSVLRLSQAVDITDYVRPACLWPQEKIDLNYIVGKKGSVVGWGFDENGVVTEELTLAEMPVVEQQTCIWSFSDFFSRFTSEHTYCAGFLNGTSVCNGDSGGGMVFQIERTWYLRGLVSLSVARQNESRCDPSHYVVFTDLAKFIDWIRNVMREDGN